MGLRLATIAAAILLAAPPALAHDGPHHHHHGKTGHHAHGMAAEAGVQVPPRREYYGHFLHGRVHHGAATHGYAGHPNAEATFHPTGVLLTEGDGFVVLVEPNLVNRRAARHVADRLTVAHCDVGQSPVRVRYTDVERHAPENLAAWRFAGSCR